MLVNGKAFEGTTHYLDTYKHLSASRGNLPWLSALDVPRFPHHQFIHRLLYLFHVHNLCFYLTGSLLYHGAGLLNSYVSAGIFMVLTERPLNILKLIFQKIPSASLIYNDFTFRLVRREQNSDIFNYDIHENGNPDTRSRFVCSG